MSRKENESSEEFGVRVQAATASALHLNTSNHTVADKVCINDVTVTVHAQVIQLTIDTCNLNSQKFIFVPKVTVK